LVRLHHQENVLSLPHELDGANAASNSKQSETGANRKNNKNARKDFDDKKGPPLLKTDQGTGNVASDSNMPDLSSYGFGFAQPKISEPQLTEELDYEEEEEEEEEEPIVRQVVFGRTSTANKSEFDRKKPRVDFAKSVPQTSPPEKLKPTGIATSATSFLSEEFGRNCASRVSVSWDSTSHDIPLDKVAWASKTTVRASHFGSNK
jgi:hypothetical protein